MISLDIVFLLKTAVLMSMSASHIQVHIRGQEEPVMSVQEVTMGGELAILVPDTCKFEGGLESVLMMDEQEISLPNFEYLPKIYADIKCHCREVLSYFRPSVMYGMQEVAAFAKRLMPQGSLEGLSWWDVIRMAIQIRMLVSVDGVELDLPGAAENIVIKVGGVKIGYGERALELEGVEVTAKLLPSEDYVPSLLEFPHFMVSVGFTWHSSTSSSLFRPFISSSTGEVMRDWVVKKEQFRSTGLSLDLCATLSGDVKKGTFEWAVGGGLFNLNNR